MPYDTKAGIGKDKGKTCVFKKDGGAKVGCTSGPAKKYLAALHTNEDEFLTKEKLKEFISEELSDYYGTESSYDLPKRQKSTSASESPLDKAERDFIDAAIRKKFKTLEYKEGKLLKQKLKKIIDDVVAAELESFKPETVLEISGGSYSQNTAGNKDNIKRKKDKRAHEKRNGKCPTGQELHHTNGISSNEVRCEPVSKNRGRKGEGGRKKVPKK